MDNKKKRVNLSDQMVLVGLGVGVVYWIIECFLYVFLSYEITFMDRLFGPTFNELSTRIVVICLFLIFGSHAQYTINKRKGLEEELLQLRDMNKKLKQDFEARKIP